jgi:hypothetical protein
VPVRPWLDATEVLGFDEATEQIGDLGTAPGARTPSTPSATVGLTTESSSVISNDEDGGTDDRPDAGPGGPGRQENPISCSVPARRARLSWPATRSPTVASTVCSTRRSTWR